MTRTEICGILDQDEAVGITLVPIRVIAFVASLLATTAVAQTPSDTIARPAASERWSALKSPDELVEAGGNLLDVGNYDGAITAFTKAIAIDPRHGHAYANRALAYSHTNRLDEARRDLSAAEALIPEHAVIHRVRALIALRQADDQTALSELTKALAKEPGDPFALYHRAWLYQEARNESAALADAEAYIDAHADLADAYVLKATLLIVQQKTALAVAEADRIQKLFPKDAYALAAAARVYDRLDERSRALEAINTAVTLDPKMYYYRLLRAQFREPNDVAGRRVDLTAALELDPGNSSVLTKLGLLDFKEAKWLEAASHFTEVLAKEPKDFGLLSYRAMAQLKAGNKELAARDYKAALAAVVGADDFEMICWSFAKENVALDWALEACDKAVARSPREASYLASRGFVKLRLDRLRDSLSDYDAAVMADDRSAHSYFGRALARWRIGDKAGADSDRIRAMAINSGILAQYRNYGFTDF